jgi:hypothetical protein
MKAIKTLLQFFILFSASALLVNTASAEIKITDADAIFETSLQSVSIPTQAIPLKKLFINSEDAVLTKNLSTVSIPTQVATLTRLFINSEDAILTKSLSSVSIPTKAVPVTKLFIVNADAILTKDLVSLSGQPPPVKPSISSFTLSLDKGLNMISLPLNPESSLTARSFAEKLGSTVVIRYDTKQGKFLTFVPEVFKEDGFPIEGGQGYIVNQLESREVVFTGTAWSNAPSKPISASPSKENPHWAFVVCGAIYDGNRIAQNPELTVTAENLRTGDFAEAKVGQLENGRYTAAFVDLSRKDVVKPGDTLGVYFRDAAKGVASEPVVIMVTTSDIVKSYIEVNLRMEDLVPDKTALLQNYPNPFNPETWIPFQLAKGSDVVISIFNLQGQMIRRLDIGHKQAGLYLSKGRAAYWDGQNGTGEQVASGVYFYTIDAGGFRGTRRMVIIR